MPPVFNLTWPWRLEESSDGEGGARKRLHTDDGQSASSSGGDRKRPRTDGMQSASSSSESTSESAPGPSSSDTPLETDATSEFGEGTSMSGGGRGGSKTCKGPTPKLPAQMSSMKEMEKYFGAADSKECGEKLNRLFMMEPVMAADRGENDLQTTMAELAIFVERTYYGRVHYGLQWGILRIVPGSNMLHVAAYACQRRVVRELQAKAFDPRKGPAVLLFIGRAPLWEMFPPETVTGPWLEGDRGFVRRMFEAIGAPSADGRGASWLFKDTPQWQQVEPMVHEMARRFRPGKPTVRGFDFENRCHFLQRIASPDMAP